MTSLYAIPGIPSGIDQEQNDNIIDAEYEELDPILELPTMQEIEKKVCELYGYSVEEFRSHDNDRQRPFVEMRMVVMWRTRELYNNRKSFAHIAGYYKKDHATAISARKTINNLKYSDKFIKKIIKELTV